MGLEWLIALMAHLVLYNQSDNAIKQTIIILLPCLITIKGCNQDWIVITFTSIYTNTITCL